MTFLRGNVQRGNVILGPCVGIGPGFEQRRDRCGMAFLRGNVQRGEAILGPCVGVGPGFKQRRDRGGMTVLSSNVQRGEAKLIQCTGVGPGPQAGARILGAGCPEEIRAVPVRAVGLRPRG